jgi:hypothetical protein
MFGWSAERAEMLFCCRRYSRRAVVGRLLENNQLAAQCALSVIVRQVRCAFYIYQHIHQVAIVDQRGALDSVGAKIFCVVQDVKNVD